MTKQNEEKVWLHGEVLIKKVSGVIPSGTVVKAIDGAYKVADSEVTGNHHLLEDVPGVEVIEKDGMFYVRTDKPLTVKCVDPKRHDAITLNPCKKDEFYIFDRQQEVDHITDEIRAVRD